jgi:ATP-dependent helicase HrpA
VSAAPSLSYPAELPISHRKDEILAVLREHQVVVVAGETGSGKTTQLPKMCLELGRGLSGRIGHTQPRRIAARTVAERIAEETSTEPGTTVGWKVRFTDHVRDDTRVKVMTDGVLLAELQHDRLLRQYDTLAQTDHRALSLGEILQCLSKRGSHVARDDVTLRREGPPSWFPFVRPMPRPFIVRSTEPIRFHGWLAVTGRCQG